MVKVTKDNRLDTVTTGPVAKRWNASIAWRNKNSTTVLKKDVQIDEVSDLQDIVELEHNWLEAPYIDILLTYKRATTGDVVGTSEPVSRQGVEGQSK